MQALNLKIITLFIITIFASERNCTFVVPSAELKCIVRFCDSTIYVHGTNKVGLGRI